MQSSIEVLRARLAAHKGRWPILAEKSKVPISTLRKVAQGRIKSPGIDTVDKLRIGLDRLESQ